MKVQNRVRTAGKGRAIEDAEENGRNRPTDVLPEPPGHLSQAAAGRWDDIVRVWEISTDDVDALLLLEAALVAFDRATEARRLLEAEGLVTFGAGGMAHPHPATRIERDSLKEMRLALKQLGLDPGTLRGGRR